MQNQKLGTNQLKVLHKMNNSKEKNIILFANKLFIYDPKNKEIQNIQILGNVIRNLKLGGKEWN